MGTKEPKSLQETMGWSDEEYNSLFEESAKRNYKALCEMDIKIKKVKKFYEDERVRQGLKKGEPVVIDSSNDPFRDFDAFCESIILE